MRADVILIALAIVLLATGVVCVCLMRRTALDLMDTAQAVSDLLPHEPAAALVLLQDLDARWTAVERRWQFVAIHEDLVEVSLALDEVRDALQLDDADSARMACTRIITTIDTILRKELPTPGNIF